MSELIEWKIGKKDEQGKLEFVTFGAQSVFSRSTGEKLAKKLGIEYSLWNWRTLKPLNNRGTET
jgi:hypothetical protein